MAIDYVSELPNTADLVIVGGGIVGAATAFHANRAGFRPLILERRPALSTLTTAAAAGGFRLQLDNEEEYRLIRESVDLFLGFEEITGQRDYDPDVRRQGYLWLTKSEERARVQREIVDAQRSWGLSDVEILDVVTTRRAFPWVSSDVIQARFRQDDGLLDPRRAALGLAAGSGARVATGCAVTGFRLDPGGGRLAGVETANGFVATRTAVIAAGPFSSVVAGWAGVVLPLTIVQRQKVVLSDVPEVPEAAPMTIDEESGAHWRPAFRGAFLLFTDPSTPPSQPAEDLPIDHSFAFRLLQPDSPQAVARMAPFWRRVWDTGVAHWMIQAGQYDITPDRRPLLGQLPVEGLFVNAGYSGHGIMGGPAGSRVLVDVVTGNLAPQENPFAPDREFVERPRLDAL
ncbi:MAG: NAD(P)/FAD-dependent oxidoreductase [Actinomycetota bacterium]